MITVRFLKIADSQNIASLHEMAFSNFFLTTLGKKFLNTFYKSIIESKKSIALGAFDEKGELIGFAVGAKMKKGFYKTLLKNNLFSLLISASMSLLSNPGSIIRLVKSFLTNETSNNDFLSYATLLSICVSPQKKGLKIGGSLLDEFEKEVVKYSTGITLTTDKLGNDYVNNFYISNNYILTDEFNQGKRLMNFYIKQLK